MRFMSMHKADAHTEAGLPPSQELMAGMGPLIEDMMKAGVFLGGEGLRPSSTGVRLNFSGGKRTITSGPFTKSNELIAGYFLVRVKSMNEAIEWASRYANLVGDVEIDIRPVTEPWDLGLFPKPEGDATTRYMMTYKADKRSEAGIALTPAQVAQLKRLTDEMVTADVFLSTERLLPSSKGMRLNFSGGQRIVTDGPFAESKELIAGFSMIEAKSMDEVIEWASRFARLTGDVEIDIRPLYEA